MQNFDYQFNVGGNFTATMEGMAESTGRFNAAVEGTHSWLGKLGQTLAVWDLASNYVSKFNDTLGGLSSSGISLDSQMHDLSAVAGVVGDGLKQIEGYARSSAKAFGIDASQAVEGYKLLLSQLSPELGKYPEALQAMGNCIATTSKLMGGDGVAAAEVLTTAMNQYGISLDDPMKASAEMARMMNVMAAAGQAGSAELPAIKVALQQCGMAAKAANVSFEETNAAIQVLDKAGKKGSEGGVALRNVLSTLAAGRFLPEKTQEELQKAGINVSALTDKTKPLKERLETLKPLLKDDALLSALFGRENANAALALINGTESLQDFTEAVTGTSSAEEQAAIIMDSYAERQARINQQFEDFKITVFQATGDLGIWLSTLMGALVPLSQLMPLLIGMGNLMAWIKGLQWAAMWSRVQGFIYAARLQMAFMNRELITGQFASNGFFINITRATLAVLRFATVGIFQALKGLGALVLSFVTGGTASATFAGVASASFGAFKLAAVTACRAVSVAIMNIPIIGWIAAAIAALVALGVYFWNTSAKFRATLKGLGASFVAVFKGIWDLAKNVFGSIGDLIKAAFSLDGQGIKDAINRLKGGFSEFGTNVGKAFNDAYNAEMAASKKAEEAKKKGKPDPNAAGGEVPTVDVPTVTPPDPTGGSLGTVGGGKSDGGGKIRNITVNVDKLVERFEIHTTNLSEDLGKVKDMVGEALLSALNDVNLAM
ncbi:phage tail tape measure protein [Bacteroides uniformis]|jgi:TP901 family phage tail tape measure protein|uniref:phage tail tape measure protein n=1 Tax=Bacteroides uniformis TaxID=820 RepID=UPI00189A78F8|nr:phage tail tape measure protein [Bacteroides uniformis]